MVVALALGLGSVAVDAPSVAAATNQFRASARSTYELVPSRGVVHVTIVYTFTNKAPSTSKSYSCTQSAFDPWYGWYSYTTICTTRTSYYYNSYSVWVEKDARAIKARASSGSVSAKAGKVDGSWRKVTLKYSPLWYGATRKITVSYDLPAGGPRSTAARHVGYVYSAFCAFGPGTNSGVLRIVVPAGYSLNGTWPMTSKASGGRTIYSTANMKSKPWEFSVCVSGSNPMGYATSPVTAADGQVVTVRAWREDTAWSGAVKAAVTDDLAKLTAFLGPNPHGPGLTIREDRHQTVAAGRFDADTNVLTLGETVTSRDEVAHVLAATWFDRDLFAADWLSEGYARWAERAAGVSDAPCTKPEPTSTEYAPNIAAWVALDMPATQAQRDRLAVRRQAACYVIAQVARAIGDDAMLVAVQAMRAGRDAWSTADEPVARDSEVVHWQDWLDVVTERGLVPAGADPDLAADLLHEYGVATDEEHLAARAAARDGYHDLLELTGGRVPSWLPATLTRWDFTDAQAAIDAASKAWTTAASVETILPAVDVDGGPVQQAVTAAATQEELDAAAATAESQVVLASDVAEAIAVKAAPRDAIQELGLAGTELPDEAVAIEAVANVDADAASAAADEIRATITGAREVGMQRAAMIGGAIGVLVVLLAGVTVVVRRRRRRAVAVEVAPTGPGDTPPGMVL